MLEDTPDEQIYVLFSKLFFMNHPLGMPVLGTPQTVTAITKDTILHYISQFHTPEKILVVAAGNVDHESLVGRFRGLFESLGHTEEPPGRRTIPRPHAGVLSSEKDLEQVHICLGGSAPHLSSDARFEAAVLNTILGGNMGAGIYLAGRIFHMAEHWPGALMLWTAGAATGVWLLRQWPQVLWLALLAPAWLWGEWFASLPPGAGLRAVTPAALGMFLLACSYLIASAPDARQTWRRALAWLGAIGLIPAASGLAWVGFGEPTSGVTGEEAVLLWKGSSDRTVAHPVARRLDARARAAAGPRMACAGAMRCGWALRSHGRC